MSRITKVLLIVDDEEDWLFLLKRVLNEQGYAVITAQNCERALDLLTHVVPHCVIVDIHLGKDDGANICRTMKTSPGFRDIPIILLSGAEQADERCAYNAYVCKADGTDRLLSTIKQVLSKSRGQPL